MDSERSVGKLVKPCPGLPPPLKSWFFPNFDVSTLRVQLAGGYMKTPIEYCFNGGPGITENGHPPK